VVTDSGDSVVTVVLMRGDSSTVVTAVTAVVTVVTVVAVVAVVVVMVMVTVASGDRQWLVVVL
jgi:hypothetical protein